MLVVASLPQMPCPVLMIVSFYIGVLSFRKPTSCGQPRLLLLPVPGSFVTFCVHHLLWILLFVLHLLLRGIIDWFVVPFVKGDLSFLSSCWTCLGVVYCRCVGWIQQEIARNSWFCPDACGAHCFLSFQRAFLSFEAMLIAIAQLTMHLPLSFNTYPLLL